MIGRDTQIHASFIHPKLVNFFPGRALKLFSGRCVRPGLLNFGACEWINCHESGGSWAGIHQKQGYENWYFIKFQSFLTKIGAKLALLVLKIATIFWKLLILEAKFYIYFSNEGFVNGLKPQLGVLWTAGEAWKGCFEGRTSPYPLFRWGTPPAFFSVPSCSCRFISRNLIHFHISL